MTWIFVALAILVAAAGIAYRLRMAMLRDGLDDDAIRAIEQHGQVQQDDPLDLDEAADEEERFWSETWDEPEPL